VVATTNFPHRVDESLVRWGRIYVKIAIPLPDEAGRAEIFVKMIRHLIARHEVPGFRMFADDLDVHALARASAGMTGADIREVLRRVQLAKAMQDARSLETDKVMTALTQKPFDTVSGRLVLGGKDTYGIDRQFLYPMVISEIRDGKVIDIAQVLPAALKK